MTEDEMVGWHKFEQALGDNEGHEAWHAAVHGSKRAGHKLAPEQQRAAKPRAVSLVVSCF